MLKFSKVWEDIDAINADKNTFFPSIPDFEPEEYAALLGRYAESHTRYDNETQFKLAFFSIDIEARPRLRAKIRANELLRNLDEDEVLEGGLSVINSAANPDTAPSTEAFEPLPYINSQSAQKDKLGKVSGLYNWKHSVGGQAYNEYLDSFRKLFRVVLREEKVVYER